MTTIDRDGTRAAASGAGYTTGRVRGIQDAVAETGGTYTRNANRDNEPPNLPDHFRDAWIDGFLDGYTHGRNTVRGAA